MEGSSVRLSDIFGHLLFRGIEVAETFFFFLVGINIPGST
jgi:hypothetical protein